MNDTIIVIDENNILSISDKIIEHVERHKINIVLDALIRYIDVKCVFSPPPPRHFHCRCFLTHKPEGIKKNDTPNR